jgi:teichuronic acid biosynthesis glycosyltransferase TuaG
VDASPLVSVVTPTHNAHAFVAETIESVLAQTHTRIEHLLVDDASDDGTGEILDSYARAHPDRIRVVHMADRAGPCRRRNDALALSRGTLIAWLDHDDVWLPEKTEREVEALERDPDATFVYSLHETFDGATGATLERAQFAFGGDLTTIFREGCFFAPSSALIRRSAMERRGLGFHESHFSFGDDLFLWLGLLLDGHALRVDDVLVRKRVHPANESTRLGRENSYLWSVEILDEFLAAYPEANMKLGTRGRRRGYARHWAAAAEYELVGGRRLRAGSYAARAAALDPAGATRYAAQRLRNAPRAIRRRAAARFHQPPAAGRDQTSR